MLFSIAAFIAFVQAWFHRRLRRIPSRENRKVGSFDPAGCLGRLDFRRL
jgi:hypothetical protein